MFIGGGWPVGFKTIVLALCCHWPCCWRWPSCWRIWRTCALPSSFRKKKDLMQTNLSQYKTR
jgi:hypothetical protein